MARQVRVEYAGGIYHVCARGNRREPIFRSVADCKRFEELWVEAVGKTGWQVFAWVLMGNHYHAVFRTPEPNLVEGMRYLTRLNEMVVWANPRSASLSHMEGQTLQSTLQRGWYFGAEAFRKILVEKLQGQSPKTGNHRTEDDYHDSQNQYHHQTMSEKIVQAELKTLTLKDVELKALKKADPNGTNLSPNAGFVLQPRVAKLPWDSVKNDPCPVRAASQTGLKLVPFMTDPENTLNTAGSNAKYKNLTNPLPTARIEKE